MGKTRKVAAVTRSKSHGSSDESPRTPDRPPTVGRTPPAHKRIRRTKPRRRFNLSDGAQKQALLAVQKAVLARLEGWHSSDKMKKKKIVLVSSGRIPADRWVTQKLPLGALFTMKGCGHGHAYRVRRCGMQDAYVPAYGIRSTFAGQTPKKKRNGFHSVEEEEELFLVDRPATFLCEQCLDFFPTCCKASINEDVVICSECAEFCLQTNRRLEFGDNFSDMEDDDDAETELEEEG